MKEFIFTWNIENFSYAWHANGEILISPRFFAGPMQNSGWILGLHPRGSENSDYLSLFLYRFGDNYPKELAFNFELSCISADTSVLYSCLIPETFITFASGQKFGYGESHFVQRHEVFGRRKALYLPNDTLTLRCKMWKSEGNFNDFRQMFGRTRLTTEKIALVGNISPEKKVEKTFHIKSELQNKELMSISVLYLHDKIDVEINPINEGKMKFSILKLSFVDKRTRRKLCELINSFFGAPPEGKWRLPFSEKRLPTENDNSDGFDIECITKFVYSTGEEDEIIEENCPLKISEFLSNYINSCVPSGKLSNLQTLSEDLQNLYKEQAFCDLEIKTQTTSFFVHKIVLCARSSVFLSMLTDKMKEKINQCIEIEDISDDTLEIFLNFLYTYSFENLEWDAIIKLYYAADRYKVEGLKFLCRSYLLKNVDVGNVCELLILTDRHYDFQLKRNVDEFIRKNEEKVFQSSMWKKFAYEHQQLAIQTMLCKYEEKGNFLTEKENQVSDKTNDVRLTSIRDDFRSLFESQIASDVVIKTESATFHAHKTVLCASSSTFRDIFRNGSGDKSTKPLEMGEWDDDTVSRMLFFLYTDSLEGIQWGIALKLYQIAHVYQIQRLQIKCSCFLLENLSVYNASSLLLLAHEHGDLKLKSVVEGYICLHDEEIFGSDEWAVFSEANFRLANETMRAMYKKIN